MTRRTLSRILAMPLAEVLGRTRQELRKLGDRALPPASRFRGTMAPDTRGAVPRTLTGLADPAAAAAWCNGGNPELAAERIRDADRILGGEVPVLGWGWRPVGFPPDWSLDPASGLISPHLPWSRIDFLNASSIGDSKAVWELNRHQHLTTVAQAYRLTGDDRYRIHVWEAIADWIDRNALGSGVNWSSSLEVAFRAVTWSWLWHLAEGRESMTRDQRSRFLRALEWHGLHVERYLSTWFSPNTHLTGEALGLCTLASFWPEAARAEGWWRTGSDVLDCELTRQVDDDGFHVERSTCYQRYTLDFYLHYLLLVRSRGDAVPDHIAERIGSLADALVGLQRPDGRLVAIGDEDGGRFLPMGEVDPLEPAATMLLAEAVLGRLSAPSSATARWELVWILGPGGLPGVKRSGEGSPSIRLLASSGLGTLHAGGDFALVSAGIQRRSRHCTGHVHDDAMGVELWLGGDPVLVDPGTFTYTGDPRRRAWLRGARAHSAVLPLHHQGPPEGRPFEWAALRTACFGTPGLGACHAHLSLRCPLDDGLLHDRLVVWRKDGGWLIWDRVRGPSPAALAVRYQLAPPAEWRHLGNGVAAANGATLLFLGGLLEHGRGRLVASDVSPIYGRSLPAQAWVGEGSHELPVDGVTLVRRSSGSPDVVRTRVLTGHAGLHRAIWIGGRAGERIGLSELIGTDIADRTSPGPVRVTWSGPGLTPLDFLLDPVR